MPDDCPSDELPDRADVDAASRRLLPYLAPTPATRSVTLSAITGADVVVKFENLQFTGSFKERGALNRLLARPPAAGVVAASAGNHAQGVAHHASRLGIDATIVMPATTPFVKVARTRAAGAHCVLDGADVHEAEITARRLATEEGRTLIHPYDDADVIAGQGTVASELIEQHSDIEVVVVPVGGGGLVAGVGAALAGTGVEVVGVRAGRFADDAPVGSGATVADGIAVQQLGALATTMIARDGTDVVAVPEHTIEAAITYFLEVEKTVAEGAGAASLAALLHDRHRFAGRRVGVVLSGGNIDPHLLATVAVRGLAAQGRLWEIRVGVDDHPGTLGDVAAVVAAEGVNVTEVTHERLSAPGARQVVLRLVVDAFDEAHARRAATSLDVAGFVNELVSLRREPESTP